jgi:hypothetical protein
VPALVQFFLEDIFVKKTAPTQAPMRVATTTGLIQMEVALEILQAPITILELDTHFIHQRLVATTFTRTKILAHQPTPTLAPPKNK